MAPSSRPAPDPNLPPTTSTADLLSHFAQLHLDLSPPETEDTWQRLDAALARLHALTKAGATKFPAYLAQLRLLADPITNSLLSERTRLSGTAGELVNSVAPRLGERFDALLPVWGPALLAICARTNRVAVKRAEKSLHLVCRHCRLVGIVPMLREAARDKSQGLRAVAVGCLLVLLQSTERDKLHRKIVDIEAIIKGGATDSNPEVRQVTKKVFELYIAMWPERVESFTKPLTPTIRRYLALPKTGALIVDVPLTAKPPPVASVPATEPLCERASTSSSSGPSASSRHASRSTASSAHRTAPYEAHHPAADPTSADIRRSLFAEQLAAARAQAKPSRTTHAQDGALRSMPAPAVADPSHRRERAREVDRADHAARDREDQPLHRVSRYGDEASQPPNHGNSASTSSQSSRGASGSHYQPTSSTGSHHHPLPVSLGPATTSRQLASSSSSSTVSSFAKASGLYGKSQILAAYTQAFGKEHLRAASHPELSKLSASASRSGRDLRGGGGGGTSGSSSNDNHSHAAMERSKPSRSRSDDTPSSDPIGSHQQHGTDRDGGNAPSSAVGADEALRVAPSDGVAERLVLAQQRELQKVQQETSRIAVEHTGKPDSGKASSSSSSVAADAHRSQGKAPPIKASRVPATRPAAPAKASAVRVARPAPTPSASRTTALRASTTSSLGSTPAATPSMRASKPQATPVSVEAKPSEPSKPNASSVSNGAKAVSESARNPAPATQQSGSTSQAESKKAKTSGPTARPAAKGRAAVVCTAPVKRFQPKPVAGRTADGSKVRAKVTSSTSAALAPKSKLVGGGAGATDKAALVRRASQVRMASIGAKLAEKQKREVQQAQVQLQAQGQGDKASSSVAQEKATVTPPDASVAEPISEAVGPPATPSSTAGTARRATGSSSARAEESGATPKRTPFAVRDANVVQCSPVVKGQSAQKAKLEAGAATAAAVRVKTAPWSSPSARIAAALQQQQQQQQQQRGGALRNQDVGRGDSEERDSSEEEEVSSEDGEESAVRLPSGEELKGFGLVRKVERKEGGMQLVLGGMGEVASDGETTMAME